MHKVVLYAIQDEVPCFVHVMLNALDMHARGWDVRVVVEGQAIKAVPVVAGTGHTMRPLFEKARDAGLFAGACKACASIQRVAEEVQATGLELIGDMSGHPAMGDWIERGYTVITM